MIRSITDEPLCRGGPIAHNLRTQIGLLMGLLGCSPLPQDRHRPASVTAATSAPTPATTLTTSTTTPPVDLQLERLSPIDHLTRVSVVLRGARPTLEELDQVAADPRAVVALVDAWLETPEFGETVRDLHAEHLQVRADTDSQLPRYGPLRDVPVWRIHAATTDEPLRLVERVVLEDRPYTEIVTADWMLADPVVALVYGLDYDPDGPEWQPTRWADGRPQAGVLSSSELWRHHVSNGSNFHRGRANFIADALLCADFATRDIVVEGGIDISDEFAVAHAVRSIPTCVGCHQALDPLAAFFFGWKGQLTGVGVQRGYSRGCHWDADLGEPPPFDRVPEDHCYPINLYVPSMEDDWEQWDLRPPSYYGQTGETLEDLGQLIADDPRFAQCTARTFYGWLTQTDRDAVPLETVAALTDVLRDADFRAKALVRHIVLSPEFGAARALTPDPEHRVPGLLTIRPEQYRRVIADLTGFEWFVRPDQGGCEPLCWIKADLAVSDVYGFRAMSGGIDSMSVRRPTHTATPTKLLVMRKFASEAAAFVVREDFGVPPEARHLLTEVEADTLDETAVRDQLALLHARVLSEPVPPDDPVIDDTWALWSAALDRSGDPALAWTLTLSALLQDVRMLYL